MLLRRPWILGFFACSVFPDEAVLPGGGAGASGEGTSQAGLGGAPLGGSGGSSGLGQGGKAEAGGGALSEGGSGGSSDAGGRANVGGGSDAGSSTGGVSAGGTPGAAGDSGAPVGGSPWQEGGSGGAAPGGCAGAVQHVLLPDADAWITEAEPKSNFGADLDLQLGTLNAEEARIVVRFDLAELPVQAHVGRAELELELRSSVGEGRVLDAYVLAQVWDEGRVTWLLARGGANWVPPGARPSMPPSDTLSIGLGTAAGTRVAWDVGADVQNAVDAQSRKVAWLLTEQQTNLPRIAFASRELAAREPRLVIETCPSMTAGPEE